MSKRVGAMVAICALPFLGCSADSNDPDLIESSHSDPVTGCVPMGLEDWTPVSGPAPQLGDTIQHEFLYGGCDDADDTKVHLSDVFYGASGDVLCATTHAFTATAPAEGCVDCELAWTPVWEVAESHGSSLCADILSYDPASLSLDFYDGMGVNLTAGQIWMREGGGSWEQLFSDDGYTVTGDSEAFLLRMNEEFTL